MKHRQCYPEFRCDLLIRSPGDGMLWHMRTMLKQALNVQVKTWQRQSLSENVAGPQTRLMTIATGSMFEYDRYINTSRTQVTSACWSCNCSTCCHARDVWERPISNGPSASASKISKSQQPKKRSKTYNSGDSLVVTHLTTNPPVHCLSTAERTGSSVFSVLWSYVEVVVVLSYCISEHSTVLMRC